MSRKKLTRMLWVMERDPRKVEAPSHVSGAIRIMSRLVGNRTLTIDEVFWIEHLGEMVGSPRPATSIATRSQQLFVERAFNGLAAKGSGSFNTDELVEFAREALEISAAGGR